MSMKKLFLTSALLCTGIEAATILPSAVTFADDTGDTSPTAVNIAEPRQANGSGGFVANGNSFTVVARARGNENQNTQQIVSIVDFDISGLSTTEVNSPGFTAILSLDYMGSLNDSQPAIAVLVGQVASNDAPDFDLGFDDGDEGSAGVETTVALNTQTLLSNVSASSNLLGTGESTPLTADVTAIVVDWFNNPASNNGLIFFFEDDDSSQGAYFDNLQIDTIPEASTATFIALSVITGVFGMRRRSGKNA